MGEIEAGKYLSRLYANRFREDERVAKSELWKVLVDRFLQRYVKNDDVVIDIAGGYGEFLSHVKAARRILVDLNPDAGALDAQLELVTCDVTKLTSLTSLHGTADVVFVSNFFEHLASKDDLLNVLAGCNVLLRPGGTLLIIQPNFRFAFREYYDFIDHTLPLTDRSLREALEITDFRVDEVVPRFLPYTTKGRPSSPTLLRLYLSIPLLWRIFGAQCFVRATRTS